MTRLGLLILCLLVNYKSISQTDTIKKIVLSEEVGRSVVKDLVRGDVCRQILKETELKNKNLNNIITVKDSVITLQEEYISVQKDIIRKFYKPKLNAYAGLQSANLAVPKLYGSIELSYMKMRIGGRYFLDKIVSYNIAVEYKLF